LKIVKQKSEAENISLNNDLKIYISKCSELEKEVQKLNLDKNTINEAEYKNKLSDLESQLSQEKERIKQIQEK